MLTKFQAIYGIDFSGAQDAGNKIWIAKGASNGVKLIIEDCLRARDLPTSGKDINACLTAIVNLIKSNQNSVFGFDFPFGLPVSLVREDSWVEFILGFPKKCKNPEKLRATCRKAFNDKELKRETDKVSHTPFSPYNLRLYKQTYYGISKILLPLVRDRGACVLPFQKPVAGKPWILEICPASTLRSLGLNGLPYKGWNSTHRSNRYKIMQEIERTCPIQIEQAEIRHRILTDNGGDALDSVIAAMASLNAIQNEDALISGDNRYWKIEGYVYV